MMMLFSGAKLPFILWFFAFAAAWFIIMSIQLDEHGFQLVAMKLYATLWNWIDLDPNKRVNVTLPTGEIMRTVMPAVPYIPEFIKTWALRIRVLLAAFPFSPFIPPPLATRFL